MWGEHFFYSSLWELQKLFGLVLIQFAESGRQMGRVTLQTKGKLTFLVLLWQTQTGLFGFSLLYNPQIKQTDF